MSTGGKYSAQDLNVTGDPNNAMPSIIKAGEPGVGNIGKGGALKNMETIGQSPQGAPMGAPKMAPLPQSDPGMEMLMKLMASARNGR